MNHFLKGEKYSTEQIYIYPQLDETKLTFENFPEETEIIKLVEAQKYINQQFPTEKEKVTKLDISWKKLEGNLDLSDFINLKKLDCSNNQLTSLNLSNCLHLTELDCYNNLLSNLILPNNTSNLKKIDLINNNFSEWDLTFLVPYTNLELLNLSDNNFTGSLDCLTNLKKLKELNISDTDLNKVDTKRLPQSLEKIEFSTDEGSNCKLTKIVPLLEPIRYGWCQSCEQPRISLRWCQVCDEKEWEGLEGQELIEKFIQQQNKRDEHNEFQWIPYQEFINIEYLAQGGFSKIYKAKWRIEKDDSNENDKKVVLKSLTNSKNITLEFLQEIANTKLVDGINCDDIVKYI